jgi:hypothetical protein
VTEAPEVKPLKPICRFDVFAETKRLEAVAHGEPEDVATDTSDADSSAESRFGGEGGEFRALDGELQSDVTFDREIIDHMGPEFYETVFQPAVRYALTSGRKYEQIRDTIRKDWKLPR